MKTRIDFITEAVAGIATVIQPNEFLQAISLMLTCISVVISLAFTFWKWYKLAHAKETMSVDDVEDLVNNIKDSVDKVKDSVDDLTRGDKNG